MKSFLLYLVVLGLLIHFSIQFDCNDKSKNATSDFDSQRCYNCMAENGEKKVNIPILNGRKCYIPSLGRYDCGWYDEPVEEVINQYEDAYCGIEF